MDLGGILDALPVPALRDIIAAEPYGDAEAGTVAAVFQRSASLGWLRMAVGDTTGRKLHAPSCTVIRSQSAGDSDHMPWWRLMLEPPERLCGVCGGPGLRDLLPMAGFAAAVDVWDAWGRRELEVWQRAAFFRLSATALTRAGLLEPDLTLASRIMDALSADAPQESGISGIWTRPPVKRLLPGAR